MHPFETLLRRAMGRGSPPEAPKADEGRRNEHDPAWEQFEADVARITAHIVDGLPAPAWAAELGLRFPCTEADIRRAFRRRAFETHPDRPGGSHRAFLRTQELLAEAEAGLHGFTEARRARVSGTYARRAAGSGAALDLGWA